MGEEMKAGGSARQRNPIARLLDFAGPRKKLVVIGCVLSSASAVLVAAMLVSVWLVVRDLVAVAPQWGQAAGAWVFGWWAFGFAAAAVAVYFAGVTCSHLAAFRTATNMRNRAMEHLGRVPLGFFSSTSTGELRRVVEGSTAMTEGAIAHRLPDFAAALVMPVAFIAAIIAVDWVMGLVCLLPAAVTVYCLYLMMGRGNAGKEGAGDSNYLTFMMNYQGALDRMNKAAVEYVRGMPVVKVFQQTADSFRSFKESIEAYRDFATAYVRLCERPQVAQMVAMNATFAVLVPAAILLGASAGDYRGFVTDFLFYAVFTSLTTTMLSRIMYSSQTLTEAQDAVMRIERILAVPVMEEVAEDEAQHPVDGSIEFRGVSFAYPNAASEALARLMAGKTVLMVAHRLSSVVGADCIHVIDAGRLVESGTHAELLETPGSLYARMWADYQSSVEWKIGGGGGHAE